MTTTARLPSALEQFDQLVSQAAGRRWVLFLDYDGTLTPIVERPELAVLPESTRRVVEALARKVHVAVISGRGLADVKRLVGIDGIYYAGSHGFEIEGPGGERLESDAVRPFLPILEQAESELRRRLAGIPGALIERKRYSIAVHYRMADPSRVGEIEAAVEAAAAGLRRTEGKKVFELQPPVEWDKGKAVLWLAQTLGLGRASDFPVFIGDDRTDEDAFEALQDWGVGIVVRDADRPTQATYALNSPEEVVRFLSRLDATIDSRASPAP